MIRVTDVTDTTPQTFIASAHALSGADRLTASCSAVDVAFGNGVFVGVGLHGLRMATRDGLKWTHRQTGEEGEHLNSVVYANGKFVAVGVGAT